jgi:hypothetical protein
MSSNTPVTNKDRLAVGGDSPGGQHRLGRGEFTQAAPRGDHNEQLDEIDAELLDPGTAYL